MKNSKYLVRPNDNMVFEVDPSNGCYRSYDSKNTRNRPNAYEHFTYKHLTLHYDYFPIEESEISKYEELCSQHYKQLIEEDRPDGHGN